MAPQSKRPERSERYSPNSQAGQTKRTKTSRLPDGRLLIADIDLELPPGRSPLQRALRTADINLPPTRSRTGGPARGSGAAVDGVAKDGSSVAGSSVDGEAAGR
ncbi:hypothetical protein ACFYPN_28720 [Streptomyces sp. NPDC005576]|uniref:hypothetical protein n=1 Tax=unclassified Streptomyces TaxID=2593676 RepID=UPI0033F01049